MNLSDYFFPQYSAARHLRKIAETSATVLQSRQAETTREAIRETMTVQALKLRIDDLENDLGFTVLVLGSLLSALEEKGTLTREDIKKELAEMDGINGVKDGKLNIRVLKQYIGKPPG